MYYGYLTSVVVRAYEIIDQFIWFAELNKIREMFSDLLKFAIETHEYLCLNRAFYVSLSLYGNATNHVLEARRRYPTSTTLRLVAQNGEMVRGTSAASQA
ncbi:hypothetical protein Gbfr_025_008 [Gluconobacter frateurii M-2]|nr:hypothetical protein Gbfr_025_008 [Gluconobacter frateurii M-2]